MSRHEISNFDDIIDSRDVISRIADLETEVSDAFEAGESPADSVEAELCALRALAEECEQNAEDWRHGVTLIRHSYFMEYCRELVSDIGDMLKEIPNYIVIDWEATARNIRFDYAEVAFDGVAYLVR